MAYIPCVLNRLLVFFFISVLVMKFCLCNHFSRSNRFSVKVDIKYKERIKQVLEEYTFSWFYEITPNVAIIEYNGKGQPVKILEILSNVYPNQIISWEKVRVYANTLQPPETTYQRKDHVEPGSNHGMDVENAWQHGYTGKGITIAISDVGINTDLLDLERNIKSSLSYNFVNPMASVSPEAFPEDVDFKDDYSQFTDHGNNVASLIAAAKENNVCSVGIAFNATIAALKIYEVQIERNNSGLHASFWTASDILSRALVYRLDEIDIFVSAWSLTEQFETLDLLNREAIEYAAKQGRRGLGTIYLVPTGPTGNGLSNNINTITVGSIGRFGKLPDNGYIDASVITSGLSDGNNLTSSSIVTTSYKNKCVSSFKGLSAASAQVAGIIALGLEANQNMSLRDVQHLLVQASDYQGLKESHAFKRNGGGRMYHGVLGFGLLNASKFFGLAKSHIPVPVLLIKQLQQISVVYFAEAVNVEFIYDCKLNLKEDCLIFVEQILLSLNMKTNNKNLKIIIYSPSGTESVLMDEKNIYGLINGSFVSTHFWSEEPTGLWKLRIQTTPPAEGIHLHNISVTIYGSQQTVKGQINSSTVFTAPMEQTNKTIVIAYVVSFLVLSVFLILNLFSGVRKELKRGIEKICTKSGICPRHQSEFVIVSYNLTQVETSLLGDKREHSESMALKH